MHKDTSQAFIRDVEAIIASSRNPMIATRFRYHEIIDGLIFGAEEGVISHAQASAKIKIILDEIIDEILS